MCTRFACRACRSDVTMPTHFGPKHGQHATTAAGSDTSTSNSNSDRRGSATSTTRGGGVLSNGGVSVTHSNGMCTVNLCNHCKNHLGGIKTKR